MRKLYVINFVSTSKINIPSQCGFCKGYSSQHFQDSYLVITEMFFKKMIHKINLYGALLTDSLKIFDCIDHILLIFKLFAFAFSPFFLKIYFYLSNLTKQTKINKSFNGRINTKFDVPQGSISRTLLFNIGIIILFYEREDTYVAS